MKDKLILKEKGNKTIVTIGKNIMVLPFEKNKLDEFVKKISGGKI